MKYSLTRLLMVALGSLIMSTSITQAKKVVAPTMYMFGFAASFNDTIVHFTDIQQVDSVWIETKNRFLQGRDSYTFQLRDYLTAQQMAHRTCVVFYHQNRTKLEKKFLKMKRLYTQSKDGKQHFDVRYIERGAFNFHAVDTRYEIVEDEMAQQSPTPRKGKERKTGRKLHRENN